MNSFAVTILRCGPEVINIAEDPRYSLELIEEEGERPFVNIDIYHESLGSRAAQVVHFAPLLELCALLGLPVHFYCGELH